MDKKEILKYVDHTLLTQTATWEEIRQILDDAIKYGTASACIPASYVKQAAEYVEGKLPICTVIGFPNFQMATAPQPLRYLRHRMLLQMELPRSIWSSISAS